MSGYTAAVAQLAPRLTSAQVAAATTQARLGRGADAALAQDDRIAVAAAVVAALGELGYTVRRFDGGQVSGIEACREPELLLVRVTDSGTLEWDRAGSMATSCAADDSRLIEALAEHGVDLGWVSRVEHGRYNGGPLIAAAARRGDTNLARATVHVIEPPALPGMPGPGEPDHRWASAAAHATSTRFRGQTVSSSVPIRQPAVPG
jgi:hypothetical protein